MAKEIVDEYAVFSGRWLQTFYSEDGFEQDLNSTENESITTDFAFDRFKVLDKNGVLIFEGTFVLNPTARPKEVDWTDSTGEDAGKTFPAIYEITKDHLVFCAANEYMERPKSYEPKYGHTIRKFVRIPENG